MDWIGNRLGLRMDFIEIKGVQRLRLNSIKIILRMDWYREWIFLLRLNVLRDSIKTELRIDCDR